MEPVKLNGGLLSAIQTSRSSKKLRAPLSHTTSPFTCTSVCVSPQSLHKFAHTSRLFFILQRFKTILSGPTRKDARNMDPAKLKGGWLSAIQTCLTSKKLRSPLNHYLTDCCCNSKKFFPKGTRHFTCTSLLQRSH